MLLRAVGGATFFLFLLTAHAGKRKRPIFQAQDLTNQLSTANVKPALAVSHSIG